MSRVGNASRVRSKLASLRAEHGDACWVCGERIDFDLPREHDEAWTFEHVAPRADGGGNANANLRLSHAICNEARGRLHQRTRLYAA